MLVPGAGGDAWYWHRLARELESRGHTTIAVDLPAGDDTAGLSVYADAIVAAAGDRDGVVVVAQSMGGFSAPLVCGRLRVELLVLLNAMIPRAGETGAQWWEATGQGSAREALAAAEGRVVSDAIEPAEDFLHDLPADVVAEALRRGGPDQSDRPFQDPFPLSGWPDVPTRVIAGRDDRLFPAAFQQRVAQERLGITPDEIPGGHLLALGHPAPLADLLESYLATTVSTS